MNQEIRHFSPRQAWLIYLVRQSALTFGLTGARGIPSLRAMEPFHEPDLEH